MTTRPLRTWMALRNWLIAGALGLAALSAAALPKASPQQTPPPAPQAPSAQSQPAATPPGTCAETALRSFHDRGAYDRCVQQVADAAWACIEKTLSEPAGDLKPAIVLDVDDTSLSNFATISADGFCMKWEHLYASWEQSAVAIGPILDLFKKARERNVAVFFITGRSERFRAATERQLDQAGYKGYAKLYLKPDAFRGKSEDYKSGAREQIQSEHYRIIANIGDQLSDLEGGRADRAFLVPNPFYGLP